MKNDTASEFQLCEPMPQVDLSPMLSSQVHSPY
jgi:hypothetical protein